MQQIRVNLPGRSYEIRIERGVLPRVGALCREVLRGKKIAVVTDSNVAPLYGKTVCDSLEAAGFAVRLLTIPAGETSKCARQLSALWEEMMAFGLTRTDAVAALGGGVVGDLAGFAAATVLRGVDFVQIPTTLLAQVDSSVGGKVAIDLQAGKNLAGAFWQPKLVVMDPATLETLPDRVFSDGMAEVIKYGCIRDRELFDRLASLGSRAGVMSQIEEITAACCDIKRQVVEQDERDTGLRMLLNFGHTFGHVYEKAYNYTTYTHGEAVAAGMVAAAKLGARCGETPADAAAEIEQILRSYGLPTAIPADAAVYDRIMNLDKKSEGSRLSFIFLRKIGSAHAVQTEKRDLMAKMREAGLCG